MSGGFFENFLGNAGMVGGGAGGMVGGAAVGGAVEGAMGAAAGGGVGALAGGVGAIPGAAVGGTAGATHGAIVGGAAGLVGGAAAGRAIGKAIGAWIDDTDTGQSINDQINDLKRWIAGDQAADETEEKTKTFTCATCKENPCAALACGVPGTKYRGGAYGCMTGTPDTVGDKLDAHHMPADSVSPLPRAVGPAIQMEPDDHHETASYGSRVRGPTYAAQRLLISRGQVYAAFLLDCADARRIAMAAGDPTRYDAAIAQATAYATCLKVNGIIN